MNDPRDLLEVEIESWQALCTLHHQWPTEAGMGVCIATWQRDEDGRMYAECPHYRYVVKEQSSVTPP